MRPVAALVHEVRLVFTAIQFLTRCPVPPWVGHDPSWLNQCVRWFPLVGMLVGLVGAAVLVMASCLWSPGVAAALAVASTVWLTGAFHEDGLADTMDALGGAVPRERALEIMKDSRIGTYGAVALVLSLVLRVVLLGSLLTTGVWAAALALVGAHTLARAAPVAVMATLPYAGDMDHAKAKPLATRVGAASAATAVALAVLLAGAMAFVDGRAATWGIAAACAVLAAAAARQWIRQRIGGYTGDTLGAIEQVCELVLLLVLAAAVGQPLAR
ncbi:adenosylcobinamide-GDP ribazoletransferase [Piscinibacter terrae]|uniref:Adenosylcobinamide-GDP ribazoletransferase n=1 Tax=Piscinibacter terrae TaxID=2496871 RepID=A0A3N7HVW2_9BURK|nr:adenosylcobinamide-GDP ribazoletransferase [Albitalea terrae]RQP26528.1 adenosylcobinamide-GDP ribazoletransferase [Albitalea terrae]